MFELHFQKNFFRKAFMYGPVFKAAVLIISLSLALCVWTVSINYYDNRAQEHYDEYVNTDVDHMQKQFLKYVSALHSGVGFFQGTDHVSRTDWYYFVQELNLEKFYQGMQGMGISLMLAPDEIRPLEKRMRAEGHTSFSLKPAGKRSQYSSIIYLEPMDVRNTQAIGYDMFSEPTRRAAMEIARDTGMPTLSGRVKLVQEIDDNVQPGVLIYLPLYKKGMKTDTVEARRNAILGYVHSSFRMYDMIEAMGIKNKYIDFQIYDGLDYDDEHLLYRSSEPTSYIPKHTSHRSIKIGGRVLEIIFTSTRKFDKDMNSQYPFYLTLAGLLSFFILLGVVIILINGRLLLKRQKKEIEINRTWLESLLEASVDGIHILDFDGNLIEWSPSFINALGYTDQEALHLNVKDWDALYPPDEIVKVIRSISDSDHMTVETIHRRKDGSTFDVEITTRQITVDGKDYIYASTRDITERKKARNELLKLSQAIEQSPNTIVITDIDGNIEYVNRAFELATGYTKSEAIGKNPRLFQSGKTPKNYYDEMWTTIISGHSWHGEFINRRKDGTEYIESVIVAPIIQDNGVITHYMAIKEDITEKKNAEEHINYLANFDLLTGLPNRLQLEERISYVIKLATRSKGNFAVMFLDLDHFKDINDTLGHSVGDALLKEVAKRFQTVIRSEDSVCRLGGDEFIFLLPNSDAEGVVHVVQKLLNSVSERFIINENELTVTASIGIAIYPFDGTDHETLSKNADAAMYRAKQNGRNVYAFFTQEMQDRTARNLLLTNALHHALERNELSVVYQPQISAIDGRIIGAESLLRWNHPEFGNISPMEFIPLAEDSGLILPIGEWVLRTAIKQAKHWIDSGFEPMIVAVNISAVQFRHHHLPELATKLLEEIGLPAKYLEIELTEAAAMHDPQSAFAIMDNFHDRGMRMSIDDFGTGYSSLSYLKKFKVYKLKIDQSFVRDINIDPEDKAIVNAIISMAHSLGLQTIAEGVETQEQLEYLRLQGCDEIQGYYHSKPLSGEDFDAYIRTSAKYIL